MSNSDEEKIYDLKGSTSLVGQLYPILKAADGSMIDGTHRAQADGSWRTEVLKNIDSKEKKLAARLIANFHRRTVPRAEKKIWINDLAALYLKQGLKIKNKIPGKGGQGANQIKERIMEITGLSNRVVTGYLEDRFKQMNFSRGSECRKDPVTPASEVIANILNSHSANGNPGYGFRLLDRFKEEYKAELMRSPIFRFQVLNSIPRQKKISKFKVFEAGAFSEIIDEQLPEDVFRGKDGFLYQRSVEGKRSLTKRLPKGEGLPKKKDPEVYADVGYYETFIQECPDCQCAVCAHAEECIERVRPDEPLRVKVLLTSTV